MSTDGPGSESVASASQIMEVINEIETKAIALAGTGDASDLSLAIDMMQQGIALAQAVKLYPVVMVVNLMNMLASRYQHRPDAADIELGIRHGGIALRVVGRNNRHVLGSIGMLHLLRYNYRDVPEDISLSIDYIEAALSISPEDDPARHNLQFNLGKALYEKYHQTQNSADLDRCIEAKEEAVRLAPVAHPLRITRMVTLSNTLLLKFKRSKDTSSINRSIQVMEEAIRDTSRDDEDLPRMLLDLSIFLGGRFEVEHDATDLDKAIGISEDAERLVSAATSCDDRAAILEQLAKLLWLRYEKADRPLATDFERIISLMEQVSLLWPQNLSVMNNLGNFLKLRFDLNGQRNDVDRSIGLFTKARKACSPSSDAISYATIQHGLSTGLAGRFQLFGDIEDLDLAIASSTEAVGLTSRDHFDCYSRMMHLATYLDLRFRHLSRNEGHGSLGPSEKDLDDALHISRQVLDEAPMNHPDRAIWLSIRGNLLGGLYEARGDARMLDEAIRMSGEAVDIISRMSRPLPANIFSDHGEWLGLRFLRTGELDDLNKAVEATARALEVVPKNNRFKPSLYHNLGRWLGTRFDRTGALLDLHYAIEIMEKAVGSSQIGEVDRPARLNVLSHCYAQRHVRCGSIDDLNRSIDLVRMAIEETPLEHPRRLFFAINLAGRLSDRGSLGNDKSHRRDLDEAIKNFDETLEILPDKHANRFTAAWTNFGSALRHRFVRFGKKSTSVTVDDINRSACILKTAASSLQPDHRHRALTLLSLGNSYKCRFDLTDHPPPTDMEEALQSFIGSFRSSSSPPSLRIQAAHEAASMLASQSKWREAAEILEEAIDLFPTLSPRSLPRSDQQHILRQIAGIASLACAMALKSGYGIPNALMLLERGRGVMFSLLMENRLDLSSLDAQDASEFLRLRERLEDAYSSSETSSFGIYEDGDGPRSSVPRYVANSITRRKAEEELQAMVRKIQADPKTGAFLNPPSVDDMLSVLEQDTIVVINVASSRCDAFVLSKSLGSVRLVELEKLKARDIERRVKSLKSSRPRIDSSLLEWLWDKIGCPILEGLAFDKPTDAKKTPQRVIWILTGALSQLPIHAAGRHAKTSSNTVLDRVMSSYCSSLRSFVHAKRGLSIEATKTTPHTFGECPARKGKKALLVGMEKTPRVPETGAPPLPDLPFAKVEIERLQLLCPRLNLEPDLLPVQSRKAMLEKLDEGPFFVHFAGHGELDAGDPLQSGLRLEDGLLTVADILQPRLKPSREEQGSPFLAYLSACLTGANDEEKLADEGIHLVNACQLAGFRHVIGTLWQVYDESCVHVAESVYEGIAKGGMTDRSVCSALHGTLVRLRDEWVSRSSAAAKPRDGIGLSSTVAQCDPGVSSDDEEELDGKFDKLHVDGDEKGRDGRLLGGTPAAAAMEAEWVPYVHYGP